MSPKIPKKQSCGGETGKVSLDSFDQQTFPESHFVSNLKKIGKQF